MANSIYLSIQCPLSMKETVLGTWIKPEIYPGGELRLPSIPSGTILEVVARLESADDIMALAQVAEYCAQLNQRPTLVLPYIPYGRQDRRSHDSGNQVHSLRMFTRMLNAMNFTSVLTYDPHSIVTAGMIDRCTSIGRDVFSIPLFANIFDETGVQFKDLVLVSPDAGALKATENLAKIYGIPDVLVCSKVRDMATGRISRLTLMNEVEAKSPAEIIGGKHVMVCDDICDGGFTFTQVADAIRPYGPASLNLSVTHGIFSKGLGVLKQYDRVFSAMPFQKTKPLWLDRDTMGPFRAQEGFPNLSTEPYYRRDFKGVYKHQNVLFRNSNTLKDVK